MAILLFVQMAPQEERTVPAPAPRSPGAPLFSGVRVVELATVVAAPCATLVMASLGAEVIKVEEPKGDYWRRFMLVFEKGRTHATAFDSVNLDKGSVVINLKKEKGLLA